jgi:DNA-binding transcriptional MerR regulator
MRIGELARRAGVSVRALRYYEEQGLLTAQRSGTGQRHYPEQAVERVTLIQNFYAAGLTSRTVLELLPCIEAAVTTPGSLDLLTTERDRIDRQIADLTRTRDRLDGILDDARGCVIVSDDAVPHVA